jgi:hypothetical protein
MLWLALATRLTPPQASALYSRGLVNLYSRGLVNLYSRGLVNLYSRGLVNLYSRGLVDRSVDRSGRLN